MEIIKQYTGGEPLAHHLKKVFSSNKKYGSNDRRLISHLCYCYYRVARMLGDCLMEEKVLTALFFCSSEPNEVLKKLKPEWNEKVALSLDEKIAFLSINQTFFPFQSIFPWRDALSEEIDYDLFCRSFLIQPDLFLRIRPGYKEKVLSKFIAYGLKFEGVGEDCIAVVNTSKVENIVKLNTEVVVQDFSSQKVGAFLKWINQNNPLPVYQVWDCCAASGGKSILAKDVLGKVDLWVSDVRENILFNLRKRFAEAGIKKYKSMVVDLSNMSNVQEAMDDNKFDLIIADVPCTGSGTWGRTPEQMHFFKNEFIDDYNRLQKIIVTNILPSLKKGGYLLYITCSVFKKENEEVVNFIQQQFQLQMIKKEVFKGYQAKADTMFAALLNKSL